MNNKSTFTEYIISPEIELDGGYAYCINCYTELTPEQNVCPNCGQLQDWGWFTNQKNKKPI